MDIVEETVESFVDDKARFLLRIFELFVFVLEKVSDDQSDDWKIE